MNIMKKKKNNNKQKLTDWCSIQSDERYYSMAFITLSNISAVQNLMSSSNHIMISNGKMHVCRKVKYSCPHDGIHF